MSQKEINSVQSVEQVIEGVKGNYKPAIDYYNRLKELIMNSIFSQSRENILEAVQEDIINVITEELSTSTIGDVIFKDFPEKAVNIIVKALNQEDVSSLVKDYVQEYNSISNKDSKEGKEQITKIVNELANEVNKVDRLFSAFKTLAKRTVGQEGVGAIDLSDIRSQMPSIQRQIIKQYLKQGGGKGIKKSAASSVIVGGYFRESIVASALAKYFSSKNLNNISAKQVGSIKISGKDTPVDVLFGEIIGKDLEKILSQMNGELDLTTPLEAVGIQVKSASLPNRITYSENYKGKKDDSNLLKKYRDKQSTALKIGQRTSILQSFVDSGSSDAYWWRKGLIHNSLSGNVIEALGPGNAIWVTGNQAAWTSDFINNFLNARLRLNFEYALNEEGDAYKATSQIILAYHNANLRYANISKSLNKKS